MFPNLRWRLLDAHFGILMLLDHQEKMLSYRLLNHIFHGEVIQCYIMNAEINSEFTESYFGAFVPGDHRDEWVTANLPNNTWKV